MESLAMCLDEPTTNLSVNIASRLTNLAYTTIAWVWTKCFFGPSPLPLCTQSTYLGFTNTSIVELDLDIDRMFTLPINQTNPLHSYTLKPLHIGNTWLHIQQRTSNAVIGYPRLMHVTHREVFEPMCIGETPTNNKLIFLECSRARICQRDVYIMLMAHTCQPWVKERVAYLKRRCTSKWNMYINTP